MRKRGQLIHRCRLSVEKQRTLLKFFANGVSGCATARATRVDKKTALRIFRIFRNAILWHRPARSTNRHSPRPPICHRQHQFRNTLRIHRRKRLSRKHRSHRPAPRLQCASRSRLHAPHCLPSTRVEKQNHRRVHQPNRKRLVSVKTPPCPLQRRLAIPPNTLARRNRNALRMRRRLFSEKTFRNAPRLPKNTNPHIANCVIKT